MIEIKVPSIDELLAEYERVSGPHTAEGKTVLEWAALWKLGPTKTRRIIEHAITTGRMATAVVLRPVITRPGYRAAVTLHRFTKPAALLGRGLRNRKQVRG